MACLDIEIAEGRVLRFEESLVTIGRSASNMVVLDDTRISGIHAEIALRDGEYFFRDLGSTNGSIVQRGRARTVVDGRNIREVQLTGGELLLLGTPQDSVALRIYLIVDESASTPPLQLEPDERYTTAGRELVAPVEVTSEVEQPGLDSMSDVIELLQGDGEIKAVMSRVEEYFVRRVLSRNGDNRTRTAKALAISRQALTEKLRRYGVAPRHKK